MPRSHTWSAHLIFWVGITALVPIAFLLNKGGGGQYNRVVSDLLIAGIGVSIAGTLFRVVASRWIVARLGPTDTRFAFRPMVYGAIFWCVFIPLLYWSLHK